MEFKVGSECKSQINFKGKNDEIGGNVFHIVIE